MNDILKLENIKMTYQAENGEITALNDISFKVKNGEFISIVGPSGCGKSTLLSIIAGIVKQTSGTVYLAGKPINGISPEVGYMLQQDNLLDWRSIRKNVLIGLEIRKMLTDENIEYANRLLKTYGLAEFADKYPSQLSGGMRQRVALIRTLATRPRLLLLDEAFSALDFQTRLAVTDDVYGILKNEGKTAVMVTHDISESISMSDRIIVLTKRPADIKEIHQINFGESHSSPMRRRSAPSFSEYFNTIWKELDVHV